MTTQSKLSTALRQKFPGPLGPRAALRALGLDADVLEVPGSNKGDDARTMRVAIENLLSELHLDEGQVKRILEVMDKHARLDELPDSDPHAKRAGELAGGEDEDADWLEKLREFFKSKGLADADIDEALRLAGGGEPAGDRQRLGRDMALDDRARAEAELTRMFGENFSRIGFEPSLRADRSRPVRGPSQKSVDEFHRMFPGAAAIG